MKKLTKNCYFKTIIVKKILLTASTYDFMAGTCEESTFHFWQLGVLYLNANAHQSFKVTLKAPGMISELPITIICCCS